MNSVITQLVLINSADHEMNGSFLALHADGSLSRVQLGYDDKGECAKVTPVPFLTEA